MNSAFNLCTNLRVPRAACPDVPTKMHLFLRAQSSSTSLSSEDSFKAQSPNLTQISMSNAHVLMLYGDKQLYACPDAKKELFCTWVDGSEAKFTQIKLEEHIAQIHKLLALSCGSILLCTNSGNKKKELYSFGIASAAGIGQGDNPRTEQYKRLSYPEYKLS